MTKKNKMEVVKKKDGTRVRPIMYGLDVHMYTNYEIFLNDIPVEKWYNNGLSSFVDLNPYILGNGDFTLTLKMLPISGRKDGLIQPRDIEGSRLILSRFEKQNIPGQSRAKNYQEIQSFNIPKLEQPVPFLEFSWDFTLNDIPFKLKGWKQSQDLRKSDREELKNQVVSYFQNLRNVLNEGKVEEYMALESNFYNESDVFEYSTVSESNNEKKEIKNELLNEAKDKMVPLVNYELKLYANGRLVTLERIDMDNYGESALRSIEEDGEETIYSIFIHRPKGSDSFEIIRK